MSNLESAKAGIKAELAHAEEGLAYYQSRVQSLENTLKQLINLDAGSAHIQDTTPAIKGKRGRKPGGKAEVTETTGKAAKKVKSTKGSNDLPFAGGTFWQDLVTTEPQSVSEILNAAVTSLGIAATKEQLKKLANRQTFALNTLVKSNVIQDSGKGRERRFFKA